MSDDKPIGTVDEPNHDGRMEGVPEFYKRPLTKKQKQVFDAYYECGKKAGPAAKKLGVDKRNFYTTLKHPNVQWHIANRDMALEHHYLGNNDFTVTKTDKMELLWKIAKAGAERGYDKQGNEVMLNPQTSVSAIAQLNAMQGHNAPTEVKVTKVEKSEEELKDSIQQLRQEFEDLLAIEGEVILESSGEVLTQETSSAPALVDGTGGIDEGAFQRDDQPFDVKIKAVLAKEQEANR